MKIKFLGTSAGWPLPRLGCNCQICTSSDPKDHRLRPSLLVNEKILIDAPPDIYHQLAKGQLPTITHIFLTHTHPDHVIGLYDLTHLYGQKEKPTIVAAEGVLKEARKQFGYPLGGSFKTFLVKAKEIFTADNTQLSYIPVEHGTVEAYAVKIKQRRLVFYAPEFRKILPSQRRNISGMDLIIVDGSSLGKAGQTKGHETIKEGIRLGKSLKAKRVLFTNIGHKTLPHQKLEEFVKEKGGENFAIAYDGLEIKL